MSLNLFQATTVEYGPESWDRFNHYAPFVKEVTISYESIICERLANGDPTRLNILPYLTNLTVTTRGSFPRAELSLFLSRSIQTLDVAVMASPLGTDALRLDGFTIVPLVSPNIERINLTIAPVGCMGSEGLVSMIEGSRNLRILSLELHQLECIPMIINSIVSLPSLDTLGLAPVCNLRPSDLPAAPIQSLRRLILEGDVSSATSHLQSLAPCSLQRLALVVRIGEEEDDPAALQVLSPFAELQDLCLALQCSATRWDHIRPSLDCRRLEQVHLRSCDSSLNLGNDEIQQMAQAWPDLQVLELIYEGAEVNWLEPPAVTLRALECFAYYCPRLEKLAIDVNAEPTGAELARNLGERDIRPHDRIVSVDLRCSLIGGQSQREVARTIDALWPNVRDIWVSWGNEISGDEYTEEEEAWTATLGIAEERRHARNEERERHGRVCCGGRGHFGVKP